ncbi:MAG: lysophospholipid acyltransferase family protein [Anaerolineae bacterium]
MVQPPCDSVPDHSPWFRRIIPSVARFLLVLLTRYEVRGVENIPREGRALLASNHLGHLDPILGVGVVPRSCEVIGLVDLYDVVGTGQVMRWYGAIPVHRDEFDRDVIRRALGVLDCERMLWVAPEARMSETGALVKARDGVAWLAARSGAPVVPVAITGTEKVYDGWRRFRRPRVTITFGEPLVLEMPAHGGRGARAAAIEANTETIMRAIAALLPPTYRGVYG